MFLNLETIPAYYKPYVKLVEQPDVIQALRISGYRTLELIHSIPEGKADFRYAAGKWSVREVLCHMLDAERIFSYRALRFARNDRTPLSGFDENAYAPHLNAEARSLAQIGDEMQHLRTSTIDLFKSFSEEMLTRKGTANNNELSVVAIGIIIAGHETHHGKVIRERYLSV
ncbi:MAG: DinB family protein [Cyclobacteriaceae bacterium]|nr:DinB family protein [Cyclobacteriaceae bacterium]